MRRYFYNKAEIYRKLLPAELGQVREQSVAGDFPYTERHLKCLWFDDRLRPARLVTVRREPVEVISPGQWNLEKGPDFLDATLVVGDEKRRLTGDVEIHVRPADWQMHRHQFDPAYRSVIAHVAYFPGYLPEGVLPPAAVQIALQPILARAPFSIFEQIDVNAYPLAAPENMPPCGRNLRDWDAGQIGLLLDAAGEERLRRKTVRLRAAIKACGAEQVFYEEFLCALGYKHNRQAFRELANRVPFNALREVAVGDCKRAYALLAGVANLLPAELLKADAEALRFFRELWDCWWKLRADWKRSIMPEDAWRRHGLRPQNHPLRRLMAAALFAVKGSWEDWRGKLATAETPRAALRILGAMAELPVEHYWSRHVVLGGRRLTRPVCLIGPSRLASILLNVVVPLLAAEDCGYAAEFLSKIPAEESNIVVRRMARALLGVTHNPQLYHTALRQQGLLQIHADFCAETRANCVECRLPEWLKDGVMP